MLPYWFMGGVLAAILVLTAAAEPAPLNTQRDPPARPAVKVLAFVGTGVLGVGLGFEITGRAALDPRTPVLEWRRHAQANSIGGMAMMGVGLCLITIAALLTRWHFPSLVFRTPSSGALFAVGWP